MKILVIGGAGYVGSHQVKLLCDEGHNVIVLDNMSTGFKKLVDKRANLVVGDIRDHEVLDIVLEDIDVVFHFAASSLVGESVLNPLKYYSNNVYGMEVLLEKMVEKKIDKIIFSSTAAVYGIPSSELISEDLIPKPINPYGETKLAMENMIKWVSNATKIKYVCLRYFNVAGASLDSSIGELHDPETHLIPNVLKALINNENINVFGDNYNTKDGTCVRDYIHVSDLVDAHYQALKYLFKDSENLTCNLGYSSGTSVMEIIKSCEKVTGLKSNIVIGDKRIGDPDSLVSNNKLALEKLEWSPKYNDMDIIIKSAYDFYKAENERN